MEQKKESTVSADVDEVSAEVEAANHDDKMTSLVFFFSHRSSNSHR